MGVPCRSVDLDPTMASRTPLLNSDGTDSRKSETSGAADFGNLVMRLVVTSLILHHGLDKLQKPEAFTTGTVEKFFPFLPKPEAWTYIAAVCEIGGCLCLALGLFFRPAAALINVTLMFAVVFHMENFGRQNYPLDPAKGGAYTFEPALAFWSVTFYWDLAASRSGLMASEVALSELSLCIGALQHGGAGRNTAANVAWRTPNSGKGF